MGEKCVDNGFKRFVMQSIRLSRAWVCHQSNFNVPSHMKQCHTLVTRDLTRDVTSDVTSDVTWATKEDFERRNKLNL